MGRRPLPISASTARTSAALRAALRQVAGDGVTANVVVPGRITTDRTAFLDASRAQREGRPVEEVAAESRATIPAGRYGEPHEYGQTVAFLASVPRPSPIVIEMGEKSWFSDDVYAALTLREGQQAA